ncbi:FG-GAP-like repeat-containing protein [Bradyrhizobium sp. WSM4349]|uniref:FG-GAP-like repeat-containing protein n=1 Tax=Bradyrhizobium sp. WSM4349 TaxID=1040988 RepID=UPI00035D176C|nr:FG-GAP-like repeat-containing protein [Bradyrhizobium sp. WSM4349]
MATAVTVTKTNNADIDGLLSGYKWSGAITYSFPDSPSDYASPYSGGSSEPTTSGFASAPSQMQAAINYAIGLILSYTNANIQYAGTNGADIMVAQSPAANPTSYAYYPGNYAAGGDVWFGTAYNYSQAALGNYYFTTALHELGHALGLKHSQEAGGPANVAVPSAHDDSEYTVMSYRSYVGASTTSGYTNEAYGYPQTYMANDILALQTMYGADYTTQAGTTVYTWSPTTGQEFINGVGQQADNGGVGGSANRIYETIWDGGGVDTYDLSNYTTNLSINLNPGASSVFSSVQLANLGNGHYASGNVYNSYLYNNDARSYIDNATGGSGNDTIIGNVIANVLNGGAGNDTITGGGGNDFINGGAGIDTVVYSGKEADYVFSYNSETQTFTIADQRVSAPDGTDTVTGVEHFQFADDYQDPAGNGAVGVTPIELAAFAPGAGGWSSDDVHKRALADVNGDGKADIVGFGQAGVFVSLATGSGHFAAPTFELAAFAPGAGGWSSDDVYTRELADVNGDGKADIVGFGQAGVFVSLATGSGHFAAITFELAAFARGAGGWSSDDLYKRDLADVNGDGKADIVGFGQAGVFVSLATGSGHFAAPTFELAAFASGAGGWSSDDLYKRELADVNGDGKADIVGFGQAGVFVSLATGSGHFAAPTFELAAFASGAGGWNSDDLYTRELADVNGDGKADIVGFGNGGVYVSLAIGSGHFAAPNFEFAAFSPGAGGWISDDLYKRELADVSGDGRADIIGFGQAGVFETLATDSGHFAWPSTVELGSTELHNLLLM